MEDNHEAVTQRVLDMVKMFLAASKRGDNTVLNLESRNKQIITNYRSVEKVTGSTATTSPSTAKQSSSRRKNPSRAKRSRLRLEKFNQKKEDEKLNQQEVGSQTPADSEATSKRLILELGKEEEPVGETPLTSPILQVDGPIDLELVKYTFRSEYAEEDIIYTLEEIFPEKNAKLESMVQCRPKCADCLCTVVIRLASGQESVWPAMDVIQTQVIQDLKRASS